MLWGSFTGSGPGKIRFLRNQESCNSQWYLKVLNTEVRSTVTETFGRDKNWILQDDGAPCHRSKIVKDCILKRRRRTFDWPPQSPDMNPIENAWSMLKYEVGKYKYDNLVDLQGAIMQTWFHQLPKQYFEKLALSMHNRLQKSIKQRGGPTSY